MILTIILLVVGFVCLIKGADFFVDGASRLALKFKVPSLIIGMTIVAMGTSAPECAVSISASLSGSNEMAIANVVGSNIFNLLIVCGICAVIAPMAVNKDTIKKDFPFAIIVGLLLLGLGAWGMGVGRIDAIIFLVLFVFFLLNMISSAKKQQKEPDLTDDVPVAFSWGRVILSIGGGLAAIVLGGQLVVNSAEVIAAGFGLSENLIGLTVCAIGTSLPELVTSIVAARKGEVDMAIGNVIGSNIFNILFVLGLAGVISPMGMISESVIDLIILTVISLMMMFMIIPKKQLNRLCGLVCVIVYIIYMVYICMR